MSKSTNSVPSVSQPSQRPQSVFLSGDSSERPYNTRGTRRPSQPIPSSPSPPRSRSVSVNPPEQSQVRVDSEISSVPCAPSTSASSSDEVEVTSGFHQPSGIMNGLSSPEISHPVSDRLVSVTQPVLRSPVQLPRRPTSRSVSSPLPRSVPRSSAPSSRTNPTVVFESSDEEISEGEFPMVERSVAVPGRPPSEVGQLSTSDFPVPPPGLSKSASQQTTNLVVSKRSSQSQPSPKRRRVAKQTSDTLSYDPPQPSSDDVESYLAQGGLQLGPSLRDGRCLFSAVATCLGFPFSMAAADAVRAALIAYALSNPDRAAILWQSEPGLRSLRAWAKKYSHPHEWGGEAHISLAEELFNIRITIHDNRPPFGPTPRGALYPDGPLVDRWVLYSDGEHYTPLIADESVVTHMYIYIMMHMLLYYPLHLAVVTRPAHQPVFFNTTTCMEKPILSTSTRWTVDGGLDKFKSVKDFVSEAQQSL